MSSKCLWRRGNGTLGRILAPTAILLVAVPAFFSSSLYGQSGEFKNAITKKLNEQLVLTRMTADGSDVVKAGSIMTLHKDGLQMCGTQAKIPLTNFYKEGKLSAGKFAWGLAMGMAQPDLPTASVPLRTFVADEKFWVTAVGVEKNELIFKIYSDVYQDARYYTQLAIPFNKKSVPTVDEMLKTVAEVMTPEPAGSNEAAGGGPPVAPPSQEPPPAPMQAIAPPPPPADAPPPPPPTVALGQSMNQVIAILGQPMTLAKAGTKVIFKYADMKVTFLNGKVSDVE